MNKALALVSVGVIIPLLISNPVALATSALLAGSVLMVPAALTLLFRAELDEGAWGPAMSVVTVLFATGQAIGPVLTGWLADATGSLFSGLALSAAILIAACLTALAQVLLIQPAPSCNESRVSEPLPKPDGPPQRPKSRTCRRRKFAELAERFRMDSVKLRVNRQTVWFKKLTWSGEPRPREAEVSQVRRSQMAESGSLQPPTESCGTSIGWPGATGQGLRVEAPLHVELLDRCGEPCHHVSLRISGSSQ